MTDKRAGLVVFEPQGRRAEADPEANVLVLAQRVGLDIESACGGQGLCGRCRIKVEAELPPPGVEEIEALGSAVDFRLACQVVAPAGATVWIPPESTRQKQVILTAGREIEFELDPAVKSYQIQVAPPRLKSIIADRERLLNALVPVVESASRVATPLSVLRRLRRVMPQGEGRVSAVLRYDWELLDLRGPDGPGPLGLAVDLGTTTVVAYLLDLTGGRTLAVTADTNPQMVHGEDVISRISFADRERDGQKILAQEAAECIDRLARAACREAGVEPRDVYELLVVGNTAMHHLLLGLDAAPLARTPYAPAASDSLEVKARDLTINLADEAVVHLLPVKAGFVGADTVAVALALEADEIDEPTLIVDLGTNGELILAAGGELTCCSTAAGPAFEGGHISGGMRAGPGAMERVTINPADLEPTLFVIEDKRPLGICGSGLVSLVAGLLRAGALLPRGGFNPKTKSDRLRQGPQGWEYVLAFEGQSGLGRDLVLTAKDVSELQLAKAAVAAGASILMEAMGLDRVSRVLLAGAFGNYLDPADACAIGLFPRVGPEMVQGVGNAAGTGAVMALLSVRQRERARRLAGRMHYIELAAHPDFSGRFTDGLIFPDP
ncbi:MAG: DUF4445 domain-containing protein [Proteobacteria bacterium]|nr:DUF4445 domain-containing protein [Pseudomonadota bacterium]